VIFIRITEFDYKHI